MALCVRATHVASATKGIADLAQNLDTTPTPHHTTPRGALSGSHCCSCRRGRTHRLLERSGNSLAMGAEGSDLGERVAVCVLGVLRSARKRSISTRSLKAAMKAGVKPSGTVQGAAPESATALASNLHSSSKNVAAGMLPPSAAGNPACSPLVPAPTGRARPSSYRIGSLGAMRGCGASKSVRCEPGRRAWATVRSVRKGSRRRSARGR